MAKSNKKIAFLVKWVLIILAIKWLIDSMKKKESKIAQPVLNPYANTSGMSYSHTVYTPEQRSIELDILEVGQTVFNVSNFPTGANLSNFSLTCNGELLINKDAVTADEPFNYLIENLGNGSYKITITNSVLVLNPDLHTLVLTLN